MCARRFVYYVTTVINAIAALAYLVMALGGSEMSNPRGQTVAVIARGFLWIRYVDWACALLVAGPPRAPVARTLSPGAKAFTVGALMDAIVAVIAAAASPLASAAIGLAPAEPGLAITKAS